MNKMCLTSSAAPPGATATGWRPLVCTERYRFAQCKRESGTLKSITDTAYTENNPHQGLLYIPPTALGRRRHWRRCGCFNTCHRTWRLRSVRSTHKPRYEGSGRRRGVGVKPAFSLGAAAVPFTCSCTCLSGWRRGVCELTGHRRNGGGSVWGRCASCVTSSVVHPAWLGEVFAAALAVARHIGVHRVVVIDWRRLCILWLQGRQ
jgi:hypothetical protein